MQLALMPALSGVVARGYRASLDNGQGTRAGHKGAVTVGEGHYGQGMRLA